MSASMDATPEGLSPPAFFARSPEVSGITGGADRIIASLASGAIAIEVGVKAGSYATWSKPELTPWGETLFGRFRILQPQRMSFWMDRRFVPARASDPAAAFGRAVDRFERSLAGHAAKLVGDLLREGRLDPIPSGLRVAVGTGEGVPTHPPVRSLAIWTSADQELCSLDPAPEVERFLIEAKAWLRGVFCVEAFFHMPMPSGHARAALARTRVLEEAAP